MSYDWKADFAKHFHFWAIPWGTSYARLSWILNIKNTLEDGDSVEFLIHTTDDGDTTWFQLDNFILSKENFGSGLFIRQYPLSPNTWYNFRLRARNVTDGIWSVWSTNYPELTHVYIEPLPIPPQPIIWAEGTYLYLDCGGIDVGAGEILFIGTSPCEPFINEINICVSNGNWVIEYATSESSDHIGINTRYGSSDATVTISPDGTPGTYTLHFYLNSTIMTTLKIIVKDIEE